MSWFGHLWWSAVVLFCGWRISECVYQLGMALLAIEKERNRRADLEKK